LPDEDPSFAGFALTGRNAPAHSNHSLTKAESADSAIAF
jgi:hypothetical protein